MNLSLTPITKNQQQLIFIKGTICPNLTQRLGQTLSCSIFKCPVGQGDQKIIVLTQIALIE